MEQMNLFAEEFKKEDQQKKIQKEKKARDQKIDFWFIHYGWKVEVGKLARISDPVAYCETHDLDRYAYCMRVKVISIDGYEARVQTTREWQEACQDGGKFNQEGLVWKVPLDSLAPIFEQNKNNDVEIIS